MSNGVKVAHEKTLVLASLMAIHRAKIDKPATLFFPERGNASDCQPAPNQRTRII